MNSLKLGLPRHLQAQIAVKISKLQCRIYKLQITIDSVVNLIDAR